jgi:hypothetical protein
MDKKIRDVIIAYNDNHAKYISYHNHVDIRKAIVFKHLGESSDCLNSIKNFIYPNPKLDSQFLNLKGYSGTFCFHFEHSKCEIIDTPRLWELIYDLLAAYEVKYRILADETFARLLSKVSIDIYREGR